jgi:hypothetical protein
MRFLLFVIDNQTRSPHSSEEIEAIDKFNEKLVTAGKRILAVGIDSPALASVHDFRTGNGEEIEAPFYTGDEFYSGLWVIEAADIAEARELAAEGSKACNRKVELRPLLG